MDTPHTLNENLSIALSLLRPGETALPPMVERTIRFLTSVDIWFQLSRNHDSRSCRDAAHRRRRLGHEGIPLWDELKSSFCKFVNAAGETEPIVIHCRADRILNPRKLADALRVSSAPERLTAEEIARFGMEYGLVNPFNVTEPYILDPAFLEARVKQIFDDDAARSIGVPGTMMTNAGSLSWAVEFFPSSLAEAIEAKVASVADPDPQEGNSLWGVRENRPIGIITGNPPESGSALWNNINSHVRTILGPRCCGDISMPPIIIHSIPEMGLSMQLDLREKEVWNGLKEAVKQVCSRGVRFLAVADNTTQYFAPRIRELCELQGVAFLSIADATVAWLRSNAVRQIALVGNKYVADRAHWSAYREALDGIEVETMSVRGLAKIEELARLVKTEGVSEAGLSRLRDILKQEVSSEHVVLAVTELSLLFQHQRRKGKSSKILIDTLALYGEYIASCYLDVPFPRSPGGNKVVDQEQAT